MARNTRSPYSVMISGNRRKVTPMRLWQPLTELRDRLRRQYPAWVLVLAAPLYPMLALVCLPHLFLLLLNWVLGPLVRPLADLLLRSRVVKWLATKRLEDFPAYVADLAGLFRWDATQAADLLQRIRGLRRILLALIVGEWAVLLAGGLIVGVSLIGSVAGAIHIAVLACFVVLAPCAILSALVLSHYHRLYDSWQSLGIALCGRCGYIREHLESPRCPECGTVEPPVLPGYAPPCRYVWSPLINAAAAGSPFMLFYSACLFDRFVLNPWLARGPHGWAILVMTASLATTVLWVLWVFRCRWKNAYLQRGDGG